MDSGEMWAFTTRGNPTNKDHILTSWDHKPGVDTNCSHLYNMFILTPIPATDPRAIKHAVGEIICAEMTDSDWARANGDVRPTVGVESHYDLTLREVCEQCLSTRPGIILSPPAPEPRTTDELLADAAEMLVSACCKASDAANLAEEIGKHLAKTE